MSGAYGGAPVFNRASPSSHAACVARIVADYLANVPTRPRRVLDIGGTATGFTAHAKLDSDVQVVIVNPERGVGAAYDYVSNIPASVADFDLAMLFGVMMYLDPTTLGNTIRDARSRLRGHGSLLLSEPDPDSVRGKIENTAKQVVGFISQPITWVTNSKNPMDFYQYSKQQSITLLRDAGFPIVQDRPELTPSAIGAQPLLVPPYYMIVGTL
jgi:SAM-dependent methyltransferase